MVQKRVTVGTTAVNAVDRNPMRRYLLVVNSSTNDINLGLGVDATTTFGIPLYGKGAYWESPAGFFEALRLIDPTAAEFQRISVIASAAGSAVDIYER